MSESTSDSDVEILLKKIANKLTRSTKKNLKKKKIERVISEENGAVKKIFKVPVATPISEGTIPLKSSRAETDLHKLYKKSVYLKKEEDVLETKGFENGNNFVLQSKKSVETSRTGFEQSDYSILNSETKGFENGNNFVLQSKKSVETSRTGFEQSDYSILNSEFSFLEDIGVPLIESTRIHSRESISALNLADTTVSSNNGHYETFENGSYEQLNIPKKSESFDKMSPLLKDGMLHVLSENKDTLSLWREITGEKDQKREKAVLVIPESDDEDSQEKFYSVLAKEGNSVKDSFSSSCEVVDCSVQTDQVWKNSDTSDGEYENDTKSENVSSEEQDSFVDVVDRSMQTEDNKNHTKTSSVLQSLHSDTDDVKISNNSDTARKADLKVLERSNDSVAHKNVSKNKIVMERIRIKQMEVRNQTHSLSSSDNSLPDLSDDSFKTCTSTILSQQNMTEENADILDLTHRLEGMAGKDDSNFNNATSVRTDIDLLKNNTIKVQSQEQSGVKNKKLKSKFSLTSGKIDHSGVKSKGRCGQNHVTKAAGSWRLQKMSSDSSEEEDLELFFQKIRSSKKQKPPVTIEVLKEFIVGDGEVSSDDEENDDDDVSDDIKDENENKADEEEADVDDECFYTPCTTSSYNTAVRITPALKATKHSEKMKFDTDSSSDEEFLPPVKHTPHVKKSVTAGVKKTVSSDSDDEDVFVKPTPKSAVRPRKEKKDTDVKHCKTETYSFLKSLTTNSIDENKRHPESTRYVKSFKKYKDELVRRLFHLYNNTVFDNKLPETFEIEWNKRLLRTAGFCVYKKDYSAKIELSTKVCDTAERVRDTLIHELCHAAVWILNKKRDGHGPFWKYWARKANRSHREIPMIARCHSYSINTKYTYECTQCGYSIGRHSKSLDTDRKVCGHCRGRFQVRLTSQNSTTPSGTPRTPRTPNRFALFVKENYGEIRRNCKELSHKDVMKTLSQEFAEKNRISNGC